MVKHTMTRRAEDQAIRVLNEKLRETEDEMKPVIESLAGAARRLLELIEQEDALRRAVEAIGGSESSAGGRVRGSTRVSRSRGRVRRTAEELLEAVSQFERVQAMPGLFGAVRPPLPRMARSDVRQESAHRSVEEVATELAGDVGGRIAARQVAQRLVEIDPGRYSDMRSAYGSVYAHLSRNPRFEKAESGVFVLVGDEDREDAPVSAGEDHPVTGGADR